MSQTVSMTTTAIAVLLVAMALMTPAAAQIVCASARAAVTNSGNPAWLNAQGRSCVNSTAGAVCTANCKPGYTSVPTPSTTCQANGTWTTPVGICAQVCRTAPDATTPAVLASVVWGDAANRNCVNAIGLTSPCVGVCPGATTGSPVARCFTAADSNGRSVWTYSGGCVDAGGCTSAPAGRPSNTKPNPNCIAANNNTACTYECNDATLVPSLSGAQSICINGVWNTTGSCVKGCFGALPTLTDGTWDAACIGKPLGYVCNGACTGTNIGSPKITCGAGGAWLRQTGGCAPAAGCPDVPPGILNAGPAPASCAGTAPTGQCAYTCNNGAATGTTYGPSAGPAVTRTCNATASGPGIWSEPSADCIQVCRIVDRDGVTNRVPALANGAWNGGCANTPIGQRCSGTCSAGNFGAPTTACGGTGFAPVKGSCSPTRVCAGVPTVPVTDGKWDVEACANTPAGQNCDVACNNGFSGSLSVACVANTATSGAGADWAVTASGTPCTRVSTGRRLI